MVSRSLSDMRLSGLVPSWPLEGGSYGTTQYLFGVLVVPLDATFGWGRASISLAYALGLIVAGLLGAPIGALVDRWGARLLMSAGSALAALALFRLAHMAALWQFYPL